MVNIQDPTWEDMQEYLIGYGEGLHEESVTYDESIVAIYYFSRDYHDGQASNLYSALCWAGNAYSPGMSDELGYGGPLDDFYEALVFKFADGYFGECSMCKAPMESLTNCQGGKCERKD